MHRYLVSLFIILFFVFTSANANINDKVKQLIGETDYAVHESLIFYLFQNQEEFYDYSQNINYKKLIETLEKNNLLDLTLTGNTTLNYKFIFNHNPKKSLNLLKDILRSQGHFNYMTNTIQREENNLFWDFNIDTNAAINPLLLSENLAKHFCKLTDIKKEGNTWTITIDTFTSDVYKPFDFISNEEMIFKKPLKEYFLKISNAEILKVYSYSGNSWRPSIGFYDEELNVLKLYKKDSFTKFLRVNIPKNTKYIKIDDLYSLANLKKGIKVLKE